MEIFFHTQDAPVIKAEFSASLIQFSVSRDLSEIILIQNTLMNRKFKNVYEIYLFVKVLTVIFDQFNASMLNKKFHAKKKFFWGGDL